MRLSLCPCLMDYLWLGFSLAWRFKLKSLYCEPHIQVTSFAIYICTQEMTRYEPVTSNPAL
jgi:hypothetical protein